MPELSAPAAQWTRHAQRVDGIKRRDEVIARLQADQRLELAALAVEDTEFGYRKYVADEVAMLLKLSPWTAARMLDEAEMFRAYPSVHARIGDGSWALAHADAVLDELTAAGLEHSACAQVIDLVVAADEARTPHQLRGAVRTAIVLLDLEEACRRQEKVTADRDVRSWDGKDGSGSALVTGPKPLIAALMASLDALIWPKDPEDTRTASQRRFDTLMDLVCGRLLPGQWQAQVIVAMTTLEGDDSQLAEIPGFGTILPSQARELVAQAGLRRVVVDQHGALVTVDPTVRRPDLRPDLRPQTTPAPRLSTDQVEPALVETCPVDALPAELVELVEVSSADQAWLATQDATLTPADALEQADPEQADPEQADPEPADPVVPADQAGPTDADQAWLDTVTDQAEVCAQLDAAQQAAQAQARQQAARTQPAQPDLTDPAATAELAEVADDATPVTDTADLADADLADPAALAEVAELAETTDVPEVHDPLAWLVALPNSAWSTRGFRHALQQLRLDQVIRTDLRSNGYVIPKPLKRYLVLRDLCCTFPGCARPASQCEGDHVLPWPRGATHEANLACECKHHHLAKHHYFTVIRLPDGTMRWTTPTGNSYDRKPRPLLRGW